MKTLRKHLAAIAKIGSAITKSDSNAPPFVPANNNKIAPLRKNKKKSNAARGRNVNGFPSLRPTNRKNYTRQDKGIKFVTKYLDEVDYIQFSIGENDPEWGSTGNNNRDFNVKVSWNEFKSLKVNAIAYKYIGFKLTFKPVSNQTSKTTATSELVSITTPLSMPMIRGQLYNISTPDLATYMEYNTPSFLIDPSSSSVSVYSTKCNNQLLFRDIPSKNWVSVVNDYFSSASSPKIAISGERQDTTSAQVLFEVLIQYKIKFAEIDKTTTSNHVMLNSIRTKSRLNEMEQMKEIKNKTKNTSTIKEIVNTPNFKDPNFKGNHKSNRIAKRIQARWDKIFTDENCYTEDEEEINKSTDSIHEC